MGWPEASPSRLPSSQWHFELGTGRSSPCPSLRFLGLMPEPNSTALKSRPCEWWNADHPEQSNPVTALGDGVSHWRTGMRTKGMGSKSSQKQWSRESSCGVEAGWAETQVPTMLSVCYPHRLHKALIQKITFLRAPWLWLQSAKLQTQALLCGEPWVTDGTGHSSWRQSGSKVDTVSIGTTQLCLCTSDYSKWLHKWCVAMKLFNQNWQRPRFGLRLLFDKPWYKVWQSKANIF